jgi:hypothetical protein
MDGGALEQGSLPANPQSRPAGRRAVGLRFAAYGHDRLGKPERIG